MCEREDFDVIAEFIDDDRSAYSGKRRPGFEALRELVAGGNVDVVVAWHPDRLTRHPRELEDLLTELRAIAARTEELAEMWATGELARAEWSAAGAALDKRQAALEAELAISTPPRWSGLDSQPADP